MKRIVSNGYSSFARFGLRRNAVRITSNYRGGMRQ